MLGTLDPDGVPYTQTSLAKAMKVTKGQIWHIFNPQRTGAPGIGERTIEGFLDLAKMSPAAFDAAVIEWEDQHPEEPQIEYDERYPNRVKAIEAARVLGLSEDAIRTVASYSLKRATDPEPFEWLEMIRDLDRRQKYVARGGSDDLQEVTEEDLPPPKLPWPK